MKIYLKLLNYSGNYQKYLIPFLLSSVVASVFGVLTLAMLKPLLDVLFNQLPTHEIEKMATQTHGTWDFLHRFEKKFASYVLENGKAGGLKLACFSVLGITLIGNTARYFSLRILENFKSQNVFGLRKAVFDHVIKMDIGFFSNERKGDLISRITTDVQEVENSIANSFSAGIKELLLLVTYLVSLFYMSWKLTLFALVMIPVTGTFLGVITKRMRTNATDSQGRLSNMISIMDEAFGSMKLIKSFLAENFIIDRFHQQNEGYRNAVFSYAKKREMANPVSEVTGIAMVAGLLYFGGNLILNHDSRLEASTFVTYIAIFSQVVRPAKAITEAFTQAQRGLVSGKRILELLQQPINIKDNTSGKHQEYFNDGIRFEKVGFSYVEGQKVLDRIDIEIRKGQTVALVGVSGGGKSTIADLLVRYYDVNEGKITIDDHNIQELPLANLREKMGVVSQEAILYNDSVFNNIALGRSATPQEVKDAALIANAHEFVERLPEKYQTLVGDRGSKLSGGQRQRISIARAILKNPPILILDEATSALDTESEKLVQEALEKLMKNRTSLVIAHRLSTIQNADQIYVVQDKKIVEIGTHTELLAYPNGYYRKLVTMQEPA